MDTIRHGDLVEASKQQLGQPQNNIHVPIVSYSYELWVLIFLVWGFFFFLVLSNIWLSYRINAIVKMRFWKVNSGILTRMTAVHMRVCTSYRFLR